MAVSRQSDLVRCFRSVFVFQTRTKHCYRLCRGPLSIILRLWLGFLGVPDRSHATHCVIYPCGLSQPASVVRCFHSVFVLRTRQSRTAITWSSVTTLTSPFRLVTVELRTQHVRYGGTYRRGLGVLTHTRVLVGI